MEKINDGVKAKPEWRRSSVVSGLSTGECGGTNPGTVGCRSSVRILGIQQ